jgi:hypothetical protein
MPSIKPRRSERTKARRVHASAKRVRSSPRAAIRPNEAWITDPQALLAAMAAGDPKQPEAVRPTRRSRDDGVTRHTVEAIAAVELPPPEPFLSTVPALREDERYAHRSDSGVVVIIRRRPAA